MSYPVADRPSVDGGGRERDARGPMEGQVAGMPLVTLLPFVFMTAASFVRSCSAATRSAAAAAMLASGCGGAQPASPQDTRVIEVRRLAAADLRCSEDRIEVMPLSGFATCEQREPETIDEETGNRLGPVGRCLAWSHERVESTYEGWAASGCGFVEEYSTACGRITRSEGRLHAIIDCATY